MKLVYFHEFTSSEYHATFSHQHIVYRALYNVIEQRAMPNRLEREHVYICHLNFRGCLILLIKAKMNAINQFCYSETAITDNQWKVI